MKFNSGKSSNTQKGLPYRESLLFTSVRSKVGYAL